MYYACEFSLPAAESRDRQSRATDRGQHLDQSPENTFVAVLVGPDRFASHSNLQQYFDKTLCPVVNYASACRQMVTSSFEPADTLTRTACSMHHRPPSPLLDVVPLRLLKSSLFYFWSGRSAQLGVQLLFLPSYFRMIWNRPHPDGCETYS